MASDLYREGKASGSSAANGCPKKIRRAVNSDDLGSLAGKVLQETRNRLKNTYGPTTETWAVGFFDGFMLRADEIRGE